MLLESLRFVETEVTSVTDLGRAYFCKKKKNLSHYILFNNISPTPSPSTLHPSFYSEIVWYK